MALPTLLTWECRTSGSESNGGGFAGSEWGAPATPSVSGSSSGGTVAANTYYIVVSFTYSDGESAGSAQTSVTVSGATSSITVTAPSVLVSPTPVPITWNVYCATASGGPYFPQGTGLTIGANRVITTTPPTSGTQAKGTDRSQSDTSYKNGTNLTVDHTTNTNVAPDGYTPVYADIDNIIQITTTGGGGAFTVGFYRITGLNSGKWVLDRSPAAIDSSGATWAMGGAVISVGPIWAIAPSSNNIWVANGTYTITSTTSNAANGRWTQVGSVGTKGYVSVRGDCTIGGTRPTIKAGVNSLTMITWAGNAGSIENLIFEGDKTNRTSCAGMSGTGSPTLFNCTWQNWNNVGCVAANALCAYCYQFSCGAAMSARGFFRCISANNVGTGGFSSGGTPTNYNRCIAYSNGSHGFSINQGYVSNCVSYGNTNSGFTGNTSQGAVYENCIAWGNTTYGIDANINGVAQKAANCAFGSNTSGASRGLELNLNPITLTVDPFTNAAGGDFSLNSTAGGGILCKATGWSTYVGNSTTEYPDVGAAQSRASSGGSFAF